MNLHQKKMIANRMRILTQREAKRNYKIIQAPFLELAREIESKLQKEETITIDLTNFINSLKRNLFTLKRKTINSTLEWVQTLFGWKLKGSVIEAIRNEQIEEYNKEYAARKVKWITRTTRETINRIITDSQAKGLNINDIASELVSQVSDMSLARARRIAVTETTEAVNITTHVTAKKAGMSKKTWLHVGGGKEDRPAHLKLDGKTIPINEKFIVNGIEAEYPHDPVLPASEVVSCHCICTYE